MVLNMRLNTYYPLITQKNLFMFCADDFLNSDFARFGFKNVFIWEERMNYILSSLLLLSAMIHTKF